MPTTSETAKQGNQNKNNSGFETMTFARDTKETNMKSCILSSVCLCCTIFVGISTGVITYF